MLAACRATDGLTGPSPCCGPAGSLPTAGLTLAPTLVAGSEPASWRPTTTLPAVIATAAAPAKIQVVRRDGRRLPGWYVEVLAPWRSVLVAVVVVLTGSLPSSTRPPVGGAAQTVVPGPASRLQPANLGISPLPGARPRAYRR